MCFECTHRGCCDYRVRCSLCAVCFEGSLCAVCFEYGVCAVCFEGSLCAVCFEYGVYAVCFEDSLCAVCLSKVCVLFVSTATFEVVELCAASLLLVGAV